MLFRGPSQCQSLSYRNLRKYFDLFTWVLVSTDQFEYSNQNIIIVNIPAHSSPPFGSMRNLELIQYQNLELLSSANPYSTFRPAKTHGTTILQHIELSLSSAELVLGTPVWSLKVTEFWDIYVDIHSGRSNFYRHWKPVILPKDLWNNQRIKEFGEIFLEFVNLLLKSCIHWLVEHIRLVLLSVLNLGELCEIIYSSDTNSFLVFY